MDARKIFALNDLRDAGILSDAQHAEALAKVEATPEQTQVAATLDWLNQAGIIYDDEVQVFKDRVLNAHLAPPKG